MAEAWSTGLANEQPRAPYSIDLLSIIQTETSDAELAKDFILWQCMYLLPTSQN